MCALRITHYLSVIAFLPFDASSRPLIPSSMLTGAWAVRIFVWELISWPPVAPGLKGRGIHCPLIPPKPYRMMCYVRRTMITKAYCS